ncbi:MAG: DUF547 domain-containing protein [Cytophagales bacterium]|nr:MAG: DUF547 domain-containing protein [Cytophagales bacterium]
MKRVFPSAFFLFFTTYHILVITTFFFTSNNVNAQVLNPQQLATALLKATKNGENYTQLLTEVAQCPKETLLTNLSTENQRKAFWLNIYNAITQIALLENPTSYQKKAKFFKKKYLIAQTRLSLDNIEHDILRHSKIKLSLGYLNKPFVRRKIKQFRLAEVDFRIHFALNCGAESCPPIAFYTPENIENQLDKATQNYLNQQCQYDKEKQIIYLPKLMQWFKADFGGKKGIYHILRNEALIPLLSQPEIKYLPYNWTLAPLLFEE